MSTKTATKHYLVDIDMLFDLRLSLVERMFSEVGTVMLHKGEWHKRETDKDIRDKLGVSSSKFWGIYRENYTDILKTSFVTNMVNKIITVVSEVMDDNHPGESAKRNITINIPYGRLTDGDIQGLKEMFSKYWFGCFDSITFSHHNYDKLSIKNMIEMGITDFFCYDWSRWLKTQYRNKKTEECIVPSFRVWFPTLKSDTDEDMEKDITDEMKKRVLGDRNVFELIGYIHCPMFELHWLNTTDVCICLPSLEDK